MKNILIIGSGRTGKTTLSNRIKETYSTYNLIHSDSIKWALIRAEGKEDYYRKHIKEQKEFEHGEYVQRVVLEFFNDCMKKDQNKDGYLLESGQLEPKLVKEYVDLEQTMVIALGHGDLTKTDMMNLCRKHDTKEHWTFGLSEEELASHADKWEEINEKLKEDCPKYGIEYIDTSQNRNEVLNEILEKICKN